MFPSPFLHIEVPDVQRVIFNILPTRLNGVPHQSCEHLIGFDRIIVVQIDFQKFSLLRIHRGFEQFLGVHFAETFEASDLDAAPANF
jgi:hypothetical protein